MVDELVRETGASAIYWNRRYGAAEIAVDSAIKARLAGRGIKAHSFNGRLLHEPWEITNQAGQAVSGLYALPSGRERHGPSSLRFQRPGR